MLLLLAGSARYSQNSSNSSTLLDRQLPLGVEEMNNALSLSKCSTFGDKDLTVFPQAPSSKK